MIKKRIISFLLAVFMIVSLMPAAYIAQASDFGPQKGIIADFSSGSIPNGITVKNRNDDGNNSGTIDADVGFDGGSSFSYTFSNIETHIVIPYSSEWERYDVFKIRIYTPVANQKVNIIINETSKVSGDDNGYYIFREHVTNGSWEELTVSMSSIREKWATSSPENLYILLNCSGWGVSNGTEAEFNAGTKTTIKGEKLHIDSIWLENSSFGAPMNAPVPSISHGTGNLGGNLDGTSSYTLKFEKGLWNQDYTDAVKVYNITDGNESEITDYTLRSSSDSITLDFNSELDYGDYKVVVYSDKVSGAKGEALSGDCEYIFSVGKGSVFFVITSVNIEDGSSGVDAWTADFRYEITFNNKVDDGDIAEKIKIEENGVKFSDYTVDCADNIVSVKFSTQLEMLTEYVISFDETLCDIYGQKLSDDTSFSFTTGKKPSLIGDDGVIFDANSLSDRSDALESSNPNLKEEFVCDNTIAGDYSYKLSYGVKDVTETVSLRKGDITGWTYINYLIYNPKASDEPMRFLIDTADSSSSDAFCVYRQPTDWEGWKLISVPIASYTDSYNPDKTQITGHKINFGGWREPRSEAGYIQIDRIWLSDTVPAAPELISTEFKNEEDNVANDLGGDNTYTFTYSSELISGDIQNAVEIYCYTNGIFEKADIDYNTEIAGDALNVKFNSPLTTGTTYKIKVDERKLLTNQYSLGTKITETNFTVGAPSPYFRVIATTPEDGSEINEISEIRLEFNNEPARLDVADYVFLYCNGEKQYNAFAPKTDGKTLILTLTKELKAGSRYNVKISDKYEDMAGNIITGETEFGFSTVASAAESTIVNVFSANNDKSFEDGLKRNVFTEETGITNLYDRAARYSYIAGSDLSKYPYSGTGLDTSKSKYLNLWVYSPEVSNDIFNIIVYKEAGTSNYTKHSVVLDWTGWKLLNIPMANIGNYATVQAVNFNFGGWSSTVDKDNYILYDEVWFSSAFPEAIKLESTNFPEGFKEASVINEVLEFVYNQKINEDISPLISIIDERGNTVNDYTYQIEDEKLKITFGVLSPATKYTVSIDGLRGMQPIYQTEPFTASFTTASDGVYLKNVSFNSDTLISGSTVTASYEIENLSSEPAILRMELFAVNEDNVLLFCESKIISASADKSDIFTLETQCGESTEKIYAYVLDENEKMLSKKYCVLSDDGCVSYDISMLSGEKSDIRIDYVSLNVNVLEVAVSASGVSDAISVEIQGDKLVSKGIVKADLNGRAIYHFVFPNDAAGQIYKVTASSGLYSDETDIGYISKDERDNLLNIANGDSVSRLAKLLVDMSERLSVGNPTEKEIADIAQIVIENNKYVAYSDVINIVKRVTALLDSVNDSKTDTLAEIIKDNVDLIGKEDDDIEYFISLSNKKQNKICEIAVKKLPADSISDFKSKLSDAIDEYTEASQTGGGSGGGNGGGKGNALSSSTYPAGITEPSPYTPIEANTVFTDMDMAPWASDSVMTLYKEGVISYPADNKFRPNDKITREEFVKMVVCAFINDVPYSSHRFTDETDGAWYNDYLAKAYSAGITKGYPDGSFGIGENITREDMVTICARTLELLGINMTSAYDGGFSDSESISDYASGYVGAMTQTGVINGMGNGLFAPKANATRAEAAKVIAGLMKLY